MWQICIMLTYGMINTVAEPIVHVLISKGPCPRIDTEKLTPLLLFASEIQTFFCQSISHDWLRHLANQSRVGLRKEGFGETASQLITLQLVKKYVLLSMNSPCCQRWSTNASLLFLSRFFLVSVLHYFIQISECSYFLHFGIRLVTFPLICIWWFAVWQKMSSKSRLG